LPRAEAALPDGRRRRQRRLGWALLVVGGPLALLALMFGVPLLGNIVGLYLIPALAECTASSGSFNHCWLWGRDVAEIANGYSIGIFLAGLINPLLLLKLLTAFLHPLLVLAWFVASVVLAWAWTKGRRAPV
jgi:hypothetical protein